MDLTSLRRSPGANTTLAFFLRTPVYTRPTATVPCPSILYTSLMGILKGF